MSNGNETHHGSAVWTTVRRDGTMYRTITSAAHSSQYIGSLEQRRAAQTVPWNRAEAEARLFSCFDR